MPSNTSQPSSAFVAASWAALSVGILAFLIGLWNASLLLSEKGFYFTVLLYGLFAAVSVQKSVRDQNEGVPVTSLYLALSWASVLVAIVLLVVGLWNSSMALSERGFYGMAFVLSLFAAITVQKNTRDLEYSNRSWPKPQPLSGSSTEDRSPKAPGADTTSRNEVRPEVSLQLRSNGMKGTATPQ